MIKMSCPYCESVHEVRKIKRTENIEFKGKLIDYEAVHYECCNCHEVFDTPEMMDENLLSVRRAYELKYESINPKKIISVRESYNASQKVFGLILGMGQLTINSYEQGKSVPDSTNRLLLQLSENPLIFFEMYEKNKDKIGEIQRNRIESSQAYINCLQWGGLENLYNQLTKSEREYIEGKTSSQGVSVTHIVSRIIKDVVLENSFEIYDNSEKGTSELVNTNFDVGVA